MLDVENAALAFSADDERLFVVVGVKGSSLPC